METMELSIQPVQGYVSWRRSPKTWSCSHFLLQVVPRRATLWERTPKKLWQRSWAERGQELKSGAFFCQVLILSNRDGWADTKVVSATAINTWSHHIRISKGLNDLWTHLRMFLSYRYMNSREALASWPLALVNRHIVPDIAAVLSTWATPY